MRKLLVVLLATLVSCSKDTQECKCDIEIIIVVGGSVGTTGGYTITGVPKPCDEDFDWQTYRVENNMPSNHWFQRTVNCD